MTTKRRWKQNFESFQNLEYVKLSGVPMRTSRQGPIVDLQPMYLERLVARALVASRNPIRGREVHFLRTATGLSMDKLARKLGLTASGVFYWEKAASERLSPVNEVAVRSFCAEELGVEISGRYSDLLGRETSEVINLEINRLRKSSQARSRAR